MKEKMTMVTMMARPWPFIGGYFETSSDECGEGTDESVDEWSKVGSMAKSVEMVFQAFWLV